MPLHWIVLLVIPGLVFGWTTALLAYVSVSCVSSVMTASVFIPNHIGMRRLELGHELSYLEQQVTTSRNIGNPPLLDFYYGGLNSQIEHHLFPRVPHNRYREMRTVVREFCAERGIPYEQVSLYQALASVGQHLGDMTAAARRSSTEQPETERPGYCAARVVKCGSVARRANASAMPIFPDWRSGTDVAPRQSSLDP